MINNKDNVVKNKSYAFALKIVSLFKILKLNKEFELASQILRSGTSIGANIEEAIGAFSKKDFIAKMGISHKEARETKFWLNLCMDSNILQRSAASSLVEDCDELIRITGKIVLTSRKTDKNLKF